MIDRRLIALATGLLFASAMSAEVRADPPPLPEIRFAEVPAAARAAYQGDRFSYMEAGRADTPALLLLHGVGANSMHWRYQLSGLSDRFRVIAWNAPGYFLSDGFAKDDPGCEDYARAVRDFLAAVGVERANILGNSFGTRVAQCFASYYPNRVVKLAMTGTGIGAKGLSEEAKAKVVAGRQAAIAGGGYGFGARVDALLGPNATPALKAEVQTVLRATQPRGFIHGVKLGLVNGYSPAEVGPKLTMPVLMIQGSADRVNPAESNADLLIGHLRQGRLERLPGIGHLPEVEAPRRQSPPTRLLLSGVTGRARTVPGDRATRAIDDKAVSCRARDRPLCHPSVVMETAEGPCTYAITLASGSLVRPRRPRPGMRRALPPSSLVSAV